jgi:hypothetical protein
MATNLVAIAGGARRLDRAPAAERGSADAGSAEAACCIICGCPGGPCAMPAAELAASRGPDCPLRAGRTDRAGTVVLRDPELLSLSLASVIVLASVVLAAF